PNESLTNGEVKSVKSVLKKAGAEGPDEFEYYKIDFSDGAVAEVTANDLANGCKVSVWGLTPSLLQLLFDLMTAGKWIMLPVMEETMAITSSAENLKGIPEDFPPTVVCATPNHLGVLLSNGIRAWKKYRDQIVNDNK